MSSSQASRINLLHRIAGNHTPCPCSAHQNVQFFNRSLPSAHHHHHHQLGSYGDSHRPLRAGLRSASSFETRGGRPFASHTPFRNHTSIYNVDGFRNELPMFLSHSTARYSPLSGTHVGDPDKEYAFEMAGSAIRYGKGCTAEVGSDVIDMGGQVAAVITDGTLVEMSQVHTVMQSLSDHGVSGVLFSDVSVEPTLHSFTRAGEWLLGLGAEVDVVIAVGGGSVMDTAKAANLYASHPPPEDRGMLHYANAPIGDGAPPPGPLLPLICIPTTAGTGSETTGVAVFDYPELNAKTGIAHRRLKPTLGVVDPLNTASMPPMVAACSGFDVLCHALESYTALPYHERARPPRPLLRPAYQGSNPISDEWSLTSLRLLAHSFERAVLHQDEEAMANTLLAATYAGIGFGNAGVHLCHGMSYPVSSWVHANAKGFRPKGYEEAQPKTTGEGGGAGGAADHDQASSSSIVPHGMSVVTHAPAVFQWTAPTDPAKHARAANILSSASSSTSSSTTKSFEATTSSALADQCEDGEEAGAALSMEIKRLMQALDMPNGLGDMGVSEKHVDSLVHGTLPQKRVLDLAPAQTGEDELSQLFKNSMKLW